jgi:hypothetical protein
MWSLSYLHTWPVQGNYNPVVTIFFANGTTVSKAYTEYQVAATSGQVIQSENLSEQGTKISIGLAIAVVMFSFVEVIRHISDFLKPKDAYGGVDL